MKHSKINSRFANKSLEEQLEILSRGVLEILPSGALESKLKKATEENRPLVVKLGADPSAPDLHLGHAVVLRKLKDFQDFGHRIVFLIGDFTGQVGDPTGRSKERPRLTREEVLKNAKTYQRQIFQILDPQKTEIQFNSTWNSKLSFEEVLRLGSCYTVAQMLEREDFQKRYRQGIGISILEFLYPLIQAYDSVVLKADIELGGMDQKFNLMVVREIQRQYQQDPEVCILMPILEGLDGTRKMSKSLGNYVGLEEDPKEIFGKIMSIPDTLILRYFSLLTSKSEKELKTIEESMQKKEKNPRDLKLELAGEILKEYSSYAPEEMEKRIQEIQNEFEQVFSKKQVPKEIPLYNPSQNRLTAVQILREIQAVDSNSNARRLIQGGGFYINQKAYKDLNAPISLSSGMVIRAGKRKFFRIP